ncbi:MAG: GPW/gp25 family protein [Saprospiraceae bacterium]
MEQSFLGTGWSFPPAFDKEGGTIVLASDVEDIKQSLHILLSTSLGERVMQPTYGCNLKDYQFEPVNNTFLGFLENMVERAILLYEPRIIVERITISEPDSFELIEGLIKISVEYLISNTNTRNNFVYDFYLREADGNV